jgi:hypothetical protein
METHIGGDIPIIRSVVTTQHRTAKVKNVLKSNYID